MSDGSDDDSTRLLILAGMGALLVGSVIGVGGGGDGVHRIQDGHAWAEHWEYTCEVREIRTGGEIVCNDAVAVLIGVDAPSSEAESLHAISSGRLEDLAPVGFRLPLEMDQRGETPDGKVLIYLYDGNRTLINAEVAGSGTVWPVHDPDNQRHAGVLRDRARDARDAHRGLWRQAEFRCLASGAGPSACGG